MTEASNFIEGVFSPHEALHFIADKLKDVKKPWNDKVGTIDGVIEQLDELLDSGQRAGILYFNVHRENYPIASVKSIVVDLVSTTF